MEFNSETKFKATKKLTAPPKNDFAFPIYIQRRKNFGVTVTCPDMGITKTLPLPRKYENASEFYKDLAITMAEVDRLALEEFELRDKNTGKKHREKLFSRRLKDHLEFDIQSLKFKPPEAALLTTKSVRTWQRWCSQRRVKRRSNGLKHQRKHYMIPYSEIEPFLKKKFCEDPRLLLNYVTKRP